MVADEPSLLKAAAGLRSELAIVDHGRLGAVEISRCLHIRR